MKVFCIVLLLASMLLILSGCAYNEGTVMTDKPAYLQFTGDATGASITLNDAKLDITLYEKKLSEHLFKCSEGIQVVSITRNGKLIYKQSIILEKGKTTQVMIP